MFKAPGQASKELHLSKKEGRPMEAKKCSAAWISEGIKIQERQCVASLSVEWLILVLSFRSILRHCRKSKQGNMMADAQNNLAKIRRRLQADISAFQEGTAYYIDSLKVVLHNNPEDTE